MIYTFCQSLVVLQTCGRQAGEVAIAGVLCCLLIHVEAHCIHCTSAKSLLCARFLCEELCINIEHSVARTHR